MVTFPAPQRPNLASHSFRHDGSVVVDDRSANSLAGHCLLSANFPSRELLAVVPRYPSRLSPSKRATARGRPHPSARPGAPATPPALRTPRYCSSRSRNPREPFWGCVRPSDSCCRRPPWRFWKCTEGIGNVWGRRRGREMDRGRGFLRPNR